MVDEKGGQHSPHAEVDVARGRQTLHARVDERIARAAIPPGSVVIGVAVFGEDLEGPIHILEFHAVFIVELLNEMARPAQPGGKGR